MAIDTPRYATMVTHTAVKWLMMHLLNISIANYTKQNGHFMLIFICKLGLECNGSCKWSTLKKNSHSFGVKKSQFQCFSNSLLTSGSPVLPCCLAACFWGSQKLAT